MAARKGIVTFGLVSIPVELHVAARSTSLDFDLLHAKDRSRIKYKLWCAEEDKEVNRKDTVKGYKVDGGYVIMNDADFEKAERATTRAIEVRHFVDARAVDPVYLERSYWVGPQPDAERPYQVLLRAMQNSKTVAVVTFVMSQRQNYALLRPDGRPDGERFALHTLYYGDEVRELPVDWKTAKADDREVKFAEEFIEALRAEFKPEAYRDEYRETLTRIIRAKARGEAIELAEAPKAPAKTTNLVEALQASIAAVRKPLAKAAPKREAAADRRRRGGRRAGRRRTRAEKEAA
jgi:DNA end-binding protein Ku